MATESRTAEQVTSEGPAARPSDRAPADEARGPLPVTVIRPGRAGRLVNPAELWRYRDLLYFLTWRDVAVRYKQTLLGVLWAVLQPLLMMAVFTVFLGRLAGLDRSTGGVPYPVFVYAGLLPWTLFAHSVTRGSQSIVASAQLITKVYFPRLLIPLAAIGACLVDFAIASLVMALMMLVYGFAPTWQLWAVPVMLVLTLAAAVGVGTLISALNVTYRDFRYVVPFTMQLWMLATPAIYAKGLIGKRWQWLAAANPVNGIVEGWRSCVLGQPFDWHAVGLSALAVGVALVVGLAYFRHAERAFADII